MTLVLRLSGCLPGARPEWRARGSDRAVSPRRGRVVHPPAHDSVQPRGLGHHLDGLGLTRSHAERIRAAVLPGAVAFAYARRWADQRFQIDPLVRHGSDRFVLVAGEVQFLDALGGVAEPAPNHDGVVKILGPVTHAAHIQRHLRLQARQRPLHVAVDLNMRGGLDGEILQTLAVAGATEALLQPRAILLPWRPARSPLAA